MTGQVVTCFKCYTFTRFLAPQTFSFHDFYILMKANNKLYIGNSLVTTCPSKHQIVSFLCNISINDQKTECVYPKSGYKNYPRSSLKLIEKNIHLSLGK